MCACVSVCECVCVCVCVIGRVCVRVLHYYRGPQPEYTPSTEDRTDVRGRLGRQIFFYALNHRQSEEGGCKIGFRGMSSDDGLRRVWTCVFFTHPNLK